jgi:hypothetical protein
MSVIEIIDPSIDSRWDQFVKEHPFGWICHLSGWKYVLESSFKHLKGYYYAILNNSSGRFTAALPLFHVKSKLIGDRIVCMPFTTSCDPLVTQPEDLKAILDNIMKKKLSDDCYFEIRTLFASNNIADDNFAKTCSYVYHYLELNIDPRCLMDNFHRTCVKQRIRKAEKSDIICKKARTKTDLAEFYRIYRINRKRLGLPSMPFCFFNNLWNTFYPSDNLELLLAVKGERVVAGLMLFKFRDRISAEFSVHDNTYLKYSPSHCLLWEAIKEGCENGFKIFDFGRTSVFNKGLLNFKKRWNTKNINLAYFYYPKSKASLLAQKENTTKYKIISTICKNAPEPVCRLIDSFCYRHLS